MKKTFSYFTHFIILVVACTAYSCQRDVQNSRGNNPPDDQYIRYTVNGIIQNFLSPSDSFRAVRSNGEICISAHPFQWIDSASWKYSSFNFTSITAPGTYMLSPGSLLVVKGIWPQSNFEYNDGGPITVTITEFGNAGEFIAGSFSGSFRAWINGAVATGTCEFRVKRSF